MGRCSLARTRAQLGSATQNAQGGARLCWGVCAPEQPAGSVAPAGWSGRLSTCTGRRSADEQPAAFAWRVREVRCCSAFAAAAGVPHPAALGSPQQLDVHSRPAAALALVNNLATGLNIHIVCSRARRALPAASARAARGQARPLDVFGRWPVKAGRWRAGLRGACASAAPASRTRGPCLLYTSPSPRD